MVIAPLKVRTPVDLCSDVRIHDAISLTWVDNGKGGALKRSEDNLIGVAEIAEYTGIQTEEIGAGGPAPWPASKRCASSRQMTNKWPSCGKIHADS
jgi:hypothetical protein